jgi:hypothetical protein
MICWESVVRDRCCAQDIRSVVAAEVEAVTMELMYLIDMLNPMLPPSHVPPE